MAKVLLLGASGFIGGSILTTLIESPDQTISSCEITAPVRQESQAKVLREHGVNAVLFSGLDDTGLVRKLASEHDIVINSASTFHTAVARAIIEGLSDRKKATGLIPHLIQTSGCGSLADRSTSGRFVETRTFSDKDNIYEYEKYRDKLESFPQRKTDIAVMELGENLDIPTHIIMSPIIYGLGSGYINRTSMQIESIVRAAKRDKNVNLVGIGTAEWDYVHIEDLSSLYELLVRLLLNGQILPSNKKGIFFSETGHVSWREVSENIAKVGMEIGLLHSDKVSEICLEQASKIRLSADWMAAQKDSS